MQNVSNCRVCQKPLIGRQALFCSTKCKNAVHQSYSSQKKRGIKRKIDFVKLLGGKCSMCGYDKNLAGLAFHHVRGKDFKLDVRSLSNRSIEPIRKEVKRCVLLCHNCHMETHNPSLDLAKLLN